MTKDIRHIGLVVFDLEKSLSFWCDILGFKIVKKMFESGSHLDAIMDLENTKITTVKLAAENGSLLELLYFHSHPSTSEWQGNVYSTGLTHIALTVENIDLLYQNLINAGYAFNSPPQLSPDGFVKFTYCYGPERLLLELVELCSK